jgi:hypothetical protein
MTEQEYNDIAEYRKYIMLQRTLRFKRRMEQSRKEDVPGGYYSRHSHV